MKVTEFNGFIVNYRENSSDEDVLTHSFEKDIFLTSIPYLKLKPNSIILDIGAHIGTFSLLLSKICKNVKIFALEPCKESYWVLEKNIEDNNLYEKIKPRKLALSNNIGFEKLFHDIQSGNWGHSIIKNFGSDFEEVRTTTLDIFLKEELIKKVDLIKFNVEGAEFKILNSTSNKTLKKINTYIILYHEDLAENEDKNMLISKLKKLGFIVNHLRISEDKKRGWITATKCYFQYYKYSLKSKIRL